ncbi:hypothetical protein SNEBB_011368 [Seison nebaliae]|nr:hypothetical protein SNEBB_011368 [Seison nebaliae]
MNEGRAICKI